MVVFDGVPVYITTYTCLACYFFVAEWMYPMVPKGGYLTIIKDIILQVYIYLRIHSKCRTNLESHRQLSYKNNSYITIRN